MSVKAVLPEVSPITVITLRFVIAVAFLWALDGIRRLLSSAKKEPWLPAREHLPAVALLGFVGVFVHHMLQANALRFTSSSSAGWLVALNPLFIATFASLLLKERFPARVKTGFAVALAGVFLIVSKGDPRSVLTSPSSLGDILMIVSGVNWAVYSTVLKRAALPYSPLNTTLWAESFGLLLLLPAWLWTGGPAEVVKLSAGSWLHLLNLGILSSALAYVFWGEGLSRLNASRVAVFQYLQPTVTMAASSLLLGEELGWWLFAGGAIIVGGIITVNRRPKEAPVSGHEA